MGCDRAERHIRTEKNRVQNIDELVDISQGMWDHGIGPASDGIPHKDAEDELELELEGDTRRSFEHLVDADMLEKINKPGAPGRYTVADWREGNDAFVMGEVPEAAQQGIENLIEHIHDDDSASGDDSPVVADGSGATVRSVVASEFNVMPEAIEGTLREGDPVDRLNDAVEAIEEADDVESRDDYGEIRFINPPKHYRLTEQAVELYETEEEW